MHLRQGSLHAAMSPVWLYTTASRHWRLLRTQARNGFPVQTWVSSTKMDGHCVPPYKTAQGLNNKLRTKPFFVVNIATIEVCRWPQARYVVYDCWESLPQMGHISRANFTDGLWRHFCFNAWISTRLNGGMSCLRAPSSYEYQYHRHHVPMGPMPRLCL